MRYLTPSEVILANEREVGPDLLADFGLLEAAVLRPQQTGAVPPFGDKLKAATSGGTGSTAWLAIIGYLTGRQVWRPKDK